MAGRESGVKIPWSVWLGLLTLVCVAAVGLQVVIQ